MFPFILCIVMKKPFVFNTKCASVDLFINMLWNRNTCIHIKPYKTNAWNFMCDNLQLYLISWQWQTSPFCRSKKKFQSSHSFAWLSKNKEINNRNKKKVLTMECFVFRYNRIVHCALFFLFLYMSLLYICAKIAERQFFWINMLWIF